MKRGGHDAVFFFAVLLFLWLVTLGGCSCELTAYKSNTQTGCECPKPAPPAEGAK